MINEKEICDIYLSGSSMRNIAVKFNTNHKLISRILFRNGINKREYKNLRGKTKFDCNKKRLCNNMATHIRFNVDYEWFMQFKDFDKLKTLNEVITKRGDRFDCDTEWYKEYILKFYNDIQFNRIYDNWIESNRDKYLKPSIDHINPKSKGGCNSLNNLQFLSWFENRSKNDMSQKEWDNIKKNINKYFINE